MIIEQTHLTTQFHPLFCKWHAAASDLLGTITIGRETEGSIIHTRMQEGSTNKPI
jgi:hypothetical protein